MDYDTDQAVKSKGDLNKIKEISNGLKQYEISIFSIFNCHFWIQRVQKLLFQCDYHTDQTSKGLVYLKQVKWVKK